MRISGSMARTFSSAFHSKLDTIEVASASCARISSQTWRSTRAFLDFDVEAELAAGRAENFIESRNALAAKFLD